MGAERRLLTVLFADLVGSTEIGSHTDPELLREQMTRYHDWMKDVAATHGGMVEKFTGDALTVFFGIPRIHDDDAERAVRCALAMQASMEGLNRALGTDFSMRIGINTGEAVMRLGDDGQFIVGDPINVAQRLQQDAKPGEVVVGLLTEQLTRTAIVYGQRRPATAKGQPRPVRTYRAIRPKTTVPQGLGKTTPIRAPLVGRERELQLLMDAFSRAAEDRQAQLLLVLGQAGIGKSRLIEEGLKRMRTGAAVHVLEGRCLPYGKGITYWPVIEMLQQDAAIRFDDDRDTAIAKLRRRLRSLAFASETEESITSSLSVILGLSDGSTSLDAEEVQIQGTLAMRRYLEGLAKMGPVVLVVDDLQWASAPILRLLEDVSIRSSNASLLWICIARPEFDEEHPGWAGRSLNASRVTLNPLTPGETAVLMSSLLETTKAPPLLLQHLIKRSEGNPLFCEEFLRMLLEDISSKGGALKADEAAAIRVPESVQALLATRLDSLPAAEKLVLQNASVIGERFTDSQLKAIAVDPAAEVDSALDRLLIKGLLFEDPTASEPGRLRFKHLLFRDVAYSSLPKADRANLHYHLAKHLESIHRDEAAGLAEILTYHARRSVELAQEMRLPEERLRLYAALALKWNLWLAHRSALRDDIPVNPEQLLACKNLLAAFPPEEFKSERLQVRLLEAERLRQTDRYEEARAVADQVRAEATTAERWDLAAAALLCAARVETRRGGGGQGEHRRLAAEAAQLFQRVGDVVGELDTQWLLAFDWMGSGGGEQAVRHAVTVIDRALAIKEFGRAALWMAVTAGTFVAAGFPQEGRRMYEQSLDLAKSLGVPPEKANYLGLASLDMLAGRFEDAVSRIKGALAEGEWEGMPRIVACRNLGVTLLRAEQLPEAGVWLEMGATLSEEKGERMSRSELCARRAVAAIRQGQLEVGAEYAEKAVDTALPDDPSAIFESRWALAELRWAQENDLEADRLFKEAFRAASGYYDDCQVEVSLRYSQFLIEQGRGEEARPLLDRADAWLKKAGYVYGRAEIAELRGKIKGGVAG